MHDGIATWGEGNVKFEVKWRIELVGYFNWLRMDFQVSCACSDGIREGLYADVTEREVEIYNVLKLLDNTSFLIDSALEADVGEVDVSYRLSFERLLRRLNVREDA